MKIKIVNETHLRFDCPGCNDIHMVRTGENGWTWNGSVDTPTLAPSVLVQGPLNGNPDGRCHSFVRGGRIEFLGDCTHALAGTTVDLPEVDAFESTYVSAGEGLADTEEAK